MVKIFTVEQIRAADQYTIKHEPIDSIDLMKRAANKAFEFLYNQLLKEEQKEHFTFFCGTGNNGGDGLVMAQRCLDAGIPHQLFVVELSKNYSNDFNENLEIYKSIGGEFIVLNESNCDFEIDSKSTIIDCIFGTGLNRKVEGFSSEIIRQINQKSNFTVSIDIPSGLFAEDNSGNDAACIVQAQHTVSFQFPKLAFLFPQNEVFVGNWHLVNIGLHPEYVKETKTPFHLIQKSDLATLLPQRGKFAHKGNFGHALIIGGCKGKFGAIILAAKSALRSGLGLLTLHIPKMANTILQTSVPEAMVLLDENEEELSKVNFKQNYTAIGIGPGMGTNHSAANALKLLIQESAIPMVIDADALNILAENKTWLSFLAKGTILTPHPGEFKRLVGSWSDDYERLQLQIELAKCYEIYVVLKGHYTSIATPAGEVFFNSSGNSGMAKGGSGDALTGIITSLLAQRIPSKEACILGVYIHGLAGDIASKKMGLISMLPSDLIDCLAEAFEELEKA